jgi:MscS family membrane protein
MNSEMITGWWRQLVDFHGTTVGCYVCALIVLILSWIARFIFIYIAKNFLAKLTARTETEADDKLVRKVKVPVGNIIFFIGLYFVVGVLRLPREPYNWHHLANNVVDTLIILMALWLVIRLVDLLEFILKEKWRRIGITQYDQVLPFVRDLAKIVAIAGAAVAVMIAWDKDPTVLLAGLGIGGLAIGFAAKDTIANIFGSITIFADRPFDVGDWVVIGDQEGVIEEVGFRTTKVRTFEKTLITIPNSIIANTPVNNFSRRPRRRVRQHIGILYETPLDKVKAAVEGMRKMLIEHSEVEEDPLLVYFDDFGDSALVIFVYYFTVTTNWGEYLRIREDVNLKIMELFEELGVEFAYPTTTVWHKGDLNIGGMPKLSDGDIGGGS